MINKHKKHNHKLTETEFLALLYSLPLSPYWQRRLDRLFDKIERYFTKSAENTKPKECNRL